MRQDGESGVADLRIEVEVPVISRSQLLAPFHRERQRTESW